MEKNKVQSFFEELYNNFNNRNIEGVTAHTTDNIKWANGMEGGYVYGHNGIREYWLKQFTLINPRVTSLDIEVTGDMAKIKVHQVVHDLQGNLLQDKKLYHHFYMDDNKVALFEIGEEIP